MKIEQISRPIQSTCEGLVRPRLTHDLLLWLLLFHLFGCTTSYHPYNGPFSGGYSEMQLNPDKYRVEYRAGGRSLLLYRCAEVTLGTGYDSFTILWGYDLNGIAVAVISLFHDQDGQLRPGAFIARDILNELGKHPQIGFHEFVETGTPAFDLGSGQGNNLPHSEIRLDENTFRLEATSIGDPALAKAVDHILLYRSAKLTLQNGQGSFVILSGDSQYGQWDCGNFISRCGHYAYYNRSMVIRTFQGTQPSPTFPVFTAKNILENIQADLQVQVMNQMKTSATESVEIASPKGHQNATSVLSGGSYRMVYCPVDGLWGKGLTKAQLEVRLLYSCAERTVQEGYEHFAFEQEQKNLHALQWRDLMVGAFDVASDGGGPLFRGPYERDGTMHGISGKIRLLPSDAVADEPFAFMAKEVQSYLGPILKPKSEEESTR